jgi:hypothetical protein
MRMSLSPLGMAKYLMYDFTETPLVMRYLHLMTLTILSLERSRRTGSLMSGWAFLVVGPRHSKKGLTLSRASC